MVLSTQEIECHRIGDINVGNKNDHTLKGIECPTSELVRDLVLTYFFLSFCSFFLYFF